MAIQTTYTNLANMKASWNEYTFSAETKVRADVPGSDPADLDIAYESAREKADSSAAARPDITPGEPSYDVYVRVVRRHRTAVS